MTRKGVIRVCLLMLFLCSPAAAQERDPVVKVSGTGAVSTKPDRARVLMHVSHVDKSVVSAKETVDERVKRVQKMLLDQGVKASDINTSGLNVHEERNEPIIRDGSRDTARLTAYRVSRSITIKVDDVSRLDVILDSALNLGTNSVQNIEFYSSKMDEIIFEAMQKASEDARRKAEFLAKQFGRKLGKAQQIEYDFKEREPQPYLLGARAGVPAFLQGSVDVTATINVVYQME